MVRGEEQTQGPIDRTRTQEAGQPLLLPVPQEHDRVFTPVDPECSRSLVSVLLGATQQAQAHTLLARSPDVHRADAEVVERDSRRQPQGRWHGSVPVARGPALDQPG
jgi:hypothetical protein